MLIKGNLRELDTRENNEVGRKGEGGQLMEGSDGFVDFKVSHLCSTVKEIAELEKAKNVQMFLT